MEGVHAHLQELPVADELKKNGFDAYLSFCMQLNVFFGNIDKATECFLKLKDTALGITEASAVSHDRLFYFALISMTNQRQGRRLSLPMKSEAKKYLEGTKQLVEAGAINLGHKYLLLEAESDAAASRDAEQTLRKYEQAVAAAARAGFLQDGALGSVLCAQFCMEEDGMREKACFHVRRAHELYVTWGATAVAASLLSRYPECFRGGIDKNRRASTSVRSRPHFRVTVILKHKSLCL